MKTKTFFFSCLLLGITLNQLSAQWPNPPNNKNGTGVVIVNRVWVWDHTNIFYFWSDAPGDLVSLSGTVNAHIEYFYKNGIPQFAKYQVYGEVQSDNPPYEDFKVLEIGTDYDNKGYSDLNLHFFGNQGSRYVIVAKTIWGGSFTIDKLIYFKKGKQ
jgi:hypothetical protein